MLDEDAREVMRRLYPAAIPVTALKRAGLVPLVAAILGLLPVDPLTGPPRDPNAQPEADSLEDIAGYWDVEMGSDVVQ